jgi:hypothetical protein
VFTDMDTVPEHLLQPNSMPMATMILFDTSHVVMLL